MLSALESTPVLDGPAEGESQRGSFVTGQLLVQFKAGMTEVGIQQFLAAERATIVQSFYGLPNLFLVNLSFYNSGSGTLQQQATISTAQSWSQKAQVEYAELNHYRQPTRMPNDPMYPYMWNLHNNGANGAVADEDIDAPEAWDVFTGSDAVVVAVLDTGVDYTHPDLAANMWVNPGEIPGNGIDDDGNGWVDDVYGIGPAVGAGYGDPMDYDLEVGHGTHVAGTIGAVGNNEIGVTGVNWNVKIMAINVLMDDTGALAGTDAVVIAGLTYVTMMKERYHVNVVVSNNSYGAATFSSAERAAIQAHINAGILFVAAAGNDGTNNDTTPFYPASYDLPGIISVGASNYFAMKSDFSNYGVRSVDLFAPGEEILSTAPIYISSADLMIFNGAGYQYMQGTSMASPHVAGAAALVRALVPEMTVMETKQLLMDTVDKSVEYAPYVLSGGRLNLGNAIAQIKTTEIEGVVYRDMNVDGIRQWNEPGVQNWTVYLDLNRNGVFDSGDPWAVTDATGAYSIITTARPGPYTVAQVLQPNWTAINPSTGKQAVTISYRGQWIAGVDFGNLPLPGAVSGIKWDDRNGNGVKDPGEPGIPGVYIYADLNNDGFIALGEPAAITGPDGSYVIRNVPATQVTIREVPSPGWQLTYPALGYYVVDVKANATIPGLNFGNTAAFDFGDAPAPYPTLVSQGGAYHGILPGFHLGALVDAESDGIPSTLANGDDLNNLDDEDGVVFPAALYAGKMASIEVTITSSAYPAGYLQGWIDFNGDGDWSDAGEHIISDRLLGTGTYTISFPVPASATVGYTFARFRFSSDPNLAAAGFAKAGEVEDYRLLILSDKPVAVADNFEVPQGVINHPLDVLANDFASSTGVLAILSVTQPKLGSVRIVGNRLEYSARSAVSPPVEQFTYTISDGTGATSTATVTVFVRAEVLTPIAVDDTYRVAPGAGGQELHVLDNDLPGVLGTMDITSVTQPAHGTAVIDDNNTPGDPLDDFIVYTPDSSFVDIDTFQYTISNANGTSTATVTVFIDPPPDDQTVDLLLEIQDLEGNPITEVNVGDEFVLVASVQDLRPVPVNRAGIYAIYMDVLYERELVAANFDAENPLGFEVVFSEDYQEVVSGDVATPGLLNEIGSIQTNDKPLGPALLEVFRVWFTAKEVGQVNFVADPADVHPLHDILYYDPPAAVAPADIRYGFTSLEIVDPRYGASGIGGGSTKGDPLDVNFDGYITPIDALLVVNYLNIGGTRNPRFDVNRDGHVTPLDALLVVNYLNRMSGVGQGEGEGEGEEQGEGEGTYLLLGGASSGRGAAFSNDLLDAPQWWTMSAADRLQQSLVSASALLPPAADWQLRVGQADLTAARPAIALQAAQEGWESLLDTLAEDVLEAWLDGPDA